MARCVFTEYPKIGCDTMPTNDQRESLTLLKLVHVGILVSLLWKVQFFRYFVSVHQEFPVLDLFFPVFFRSQQVLVAAYSLSVLGSLLILVLRSKPHIVVLGAISTIGLSILCLHQSAYNDVTFLCCAWTSVWCLWFASRLGESFETLFPRAVWLSHLVLSLIFIGGVVGKFSPGYWSGEVLYEIYFKERDFWIYNLLRNSMTEEALRNAAMWHSRMVICSELACSFLWLMPRKIASVVAIVVLCGIALTNNLFLFSVVSCLIGLALVGLHERKQVQPVESS